MRRLVLGLLMLLASASPVRLLLAAEQPMLHRQAPAFSLESLAGETVSLDDQRDKFVVLHFGTGW